MNTLVCFKTIPDLDSLSGHPWEISAQSTVNIRYVRQMFNCFDESALEMALKLSERLDSKRHRAGERPFELTALTLDNDAANLFLKHLLALDYDHAVRIEPDKTFDLRFDPLGIVRIISSYIQTSGHQELVIAGAQRSPGANGQTGLLLAECLRWPCISNVSDIQPGPGRDSLTVSHHMNGAAITQTVVAPMVLVVGNAPESPYLRVPTLKQKLSAGQKRIIELSGSDFNRSDCVQRGKCTSPRLVGLTPINASETCTFIEAQSLKKKMEILFDQYLTDGQTE